MYALGEMKIHLDPNKEFKPCQVTTARQVPVHMKAMADSDGTVEADTSGSSLPRLIWLDHDDG